AYSRPRPSPPPPRLRDDDSFSCSESIGLDHYWRIFTTKFATLQNCQRVVSGLKCAISCRRNSMSFHEVLRESFTSLEPSSFARRTDDPQAAIFECINNTGSKRCFRADNR